MSSSMVIASDVNLRFGYLGTSGKARSEDSQRRFRRHRRRTVSIFQSFRHCLKNAFSWLQQIEFLHLAQIDGSKATPENASLSLSKVVSMSADPYSARLSP